MTASLLAALLLASPLQLAPETGLPAASAAQGQYGAVIVQTDPSQTAVAVMLRFPNGSAQDEEGREGTAHLLAEVMEAEATRQLAQRPIRVGFEATRDEFLVSLLAPPGQWRAGLSTVTELLADAPLPEGALERARDNQLARLMFEAGAPVRSFELERVRLVRGTGSPASRPVEGTFASLRDIALSDLEAFRSRHLDVGAAIAAVVGPVSADEAAAVLPGEVRSVSARSPFREADPPEPTPPQPAGTDTLQVTAAELPAPPRTRLHRGTLPSLGVPSSPRGSPAWSEGDRREMDREVTSIWFAVAWPFPPGTPRTLLEFLALTLEEGLVGSPPEPGLYGAETEVQVLDDQPILILSVSADPRQAARWEERTLQGMEDVVESPPEGSFFDLSRRRFRNQVLLNMAGPLERSRWLARTLAETGEIPDPQAEIWGLTREGLAEAAAAAGPPRTLVLGPLDMMRGHR